MLYRFQRYIFRLKTGFPFLKICVTSCDIRCEATENISRDVTQISKKGNLCNRFYISVPLLATGLSTSIILYIIKKFLCDGHV